MTSAAFYRAVMRASGDPRRDLAIRATAAVFHTLRDRLTLQEADQVAAQLPRDLQTVWHAGQHPGPRPVKLKRAEFYERVRQEAGLPSVKEARWMTLAVLGALKEALSPGEAEDVLAQLPKGLKEVWAEAQA